MKLVSLVLLVITAQTSAAIPVEERAARDAIFGKAGGRGWINGSVGLDAWEQSTGMMLLATRVGAHPNDTVSVDGFEPYAGPVPTQVCPHTPDSNGFFTLTSSASNYVARLPVGYDAQNPQPQRLLVAIHGCGDTAMNFASWGAAPFDVRPTQNYIAISVGGRDSQCWSIGTDDHLVTEAIEHVSSCFYVHAHKIVLAGYSSGGELAYHLAMETTRDYAGVLIENSSFSSAVGGASHVDAALTAAGWPINIAHSARINDLSYPIDGARADRVKILAHAFPLQYRELPGNHEGTSDDWSQYLIPKMANWVSP